MRRSSSSNSSSTTSPLERLGGLDARGKQRVPLPGSDTLRCVYALRATLPFSSPRVIGEHPATGASISPPRSEPRAIGIPRMFVARATVCREAPQRRIQWKQLVRATGKDPLRQPPLTAGVGRSVDQPQNQSSCCRPPFTTSGGLTAFRSIRPRNVWRRSMDPIPR
jgi:hypothetical protein